MIKNDEIIKAYGKDFKAMTKRLLERAELATEIPGGSTIGIKPNLVVSSPAKFGATTHPEIVVGIIEYLKENGFNDIVITEGSWVGDKTADAFEYCGYNSLASEYDVKIIDTQLDTYHEVDAAGIKLNICDCVDHIDYLINVPVLKGHCQTKMTCALKNMKGLIPNVEKRRFHKLGLHKPIGHLSQLIKPNFIVIDHICGDPDFEEGGSPLVRNCIMVAKDPVLVDSYAASILGYEKEEIPYISVAEKLGTGISDLSKLHIITLEGENTEDLPDRHKILDVNYAVEEVESCSACYGMLISALTQLKEEGLIDKLDKKIAIGQGWREKSGELGIGSCTKNFKCSLQGCPPKAEEIYEFLKKQIKL